MIKPFRIFASSKLSSGDQWSDVLPFRAARHWCAMRLTQSNRWVRRLLVLPLLLTGLVAQAAIYTFPGVLPEGCNGSRGSYTCGAVALSPGDTISIPVNTPTVINFTSSLAAGTDSRINELGSSSLTLMVAGTISIGAGSKVVANLIGGDVVAVGDNTKYTGDITTSQSVITIGAGNTVVGNLTTGSAAIGVGDNTTITGSIQTTVAGVVTLGANNHLVGDITTKSGAINTGANTSVVGNLTTELAGVISVGAGGTVSGSMTTVSGALNIGAGANVDGSLISSLAGAVTTGALSKVGGGISTESGAVTTGNGSLVKSSICTNLAGAISVGDDSTVGGNLQSQNGAVTVGDRTGIGGTVTATVGAITVAKSSTTGEIKSTKACAGGPQFNPSPPGPPTLLRKWRQLYMRS